ncbi:hypothetical protein FA13DRAFT_1780575 [Coprinellus micaceus]|uniref:Uncharacterized protein n=1 Tax=Coprinellus micaceus TaxID=71717 RepID=A0A4Y7SCU3_COPMI|nr:hypothetical protein FA13DRAFT_1780575 [Coprinellus micaceus]
MPSTMQLELVTLGKASKGAGDIAQAVAPGAGPRAEQGSHAAKPKTKNRKLGLATMVHRTRGRYITRGVECGVKAEAEPGVGNVERRDNENLGGMKKPEKERKRPVCLYTELANRQSPTHSSSPYLHPRQTADPTMDVTSSPHLFASSTRSPDTSRTPYIPDPRHVHTLSSILSFTPVLASRFSLFLSDVPSSLVSGVIPDNGTNVIEPIRISSLRSTSPGSSMTDSRLPITDFHSSSFAESIIHNLGTPLVAWNFKFEFEVCFQVQATRRATTYLTRHFSALDTEIDWTPPTDRVPQALLPVNHSTVIEDEHT